jgi:hypothetical protein
VSARTSCACAGADPSSMTIASQSRRDWPRSVPISSARQRARFLVGMTTEILGFDMAERAPRSSRATSSTRTPSYAVDRGRASSRHTTSFAFSRPSQQARCAGTSAGVAGSGAPDHGRPMRPSGRAGRWLGRRGSRGIGGRAARPWGVTRRSFESPPPLAAVYAFPGFRLTAAGCLTIHISSPEGPPGGSPRGPRRS